MYVAWATQALQDGVSGTTAGWISSGSEARRRVRATDDASQSPKAIMFAKQIGGSTTGKQPPKS